MYINKFSTSFQRSLGQVILSKFYIKLKIRYFQVICKYIIIIVQYGDNMSYNFFWKMYHSAICAPEQTWEEINWLWELYSVRSNIWVLHQKANGGDLKKLRQIIKIDTFVNAVPSVLIWEQGQCQNFLYCEGKGRTWE